MSLTMNKCEYAMFEMNGCFAAHILRMFFVVVWGCFSCKCDWSYIGGIVDMNVVVFVVVGFFFGSGS